MPDAPRIVVLMPAHNEAGRVGDTVRAALALAGVDRVVAIDDASGDGTADEALAAGAEVVTLARRAGKGGALAAGFAHLGEAPGVLLLLDADLGSSAAEASALIEPIVTGAADMAIGILPKPPGSGGVGAVLRLARRGIQRLGDPGFAALAPLSGQRALGPAAIEACLPFADGFGVEVALTVKALRAGLRVVEVPVEMSHSATGRDVAGFAHRARQYADVRRTLRALARG